MNGRRHVSMMGSPIENPWRPCLLVRWICSMKPWNIKMP
jgi:hypothetical protein